MLLDGQPVLSCLVLPVECQGRPITTVEGMASDGALHPLQQAFVELGAAQCGYCTPGFLLAAQSLLEQNPRPTRQEIAEATEYEWHTDATKDPFVKFLNKAMQAGSGS